MRRAACDGAAFANSRKSRMFGTLSPSFCDRRACSALLALRVLLCGQSPYGIQMFFTCTAWRRNGLPSLARSNQLNWWP
jgi:hypothetical protein